MGHRSHIISWDTPRLHVELSADEHTPVSIVSLRPAVAGQAPETFGVSIDRNTLAHLINPATSAQGLVEIIASGHGRAWSSTRYTDTIIGERLRYVAHRVRTEAGRTAGEWSVLEIEQADPVSGLRVVTTLRSHESVAGLQAWTAVTNESDTVLRLRAVTSLVVGSFPSTELEAIDVLWASTDWLGESRWTTCAVRNQPVIDLSRSDHEHDPRGAFRVTGLGAWSTGQTLPTGVLLDRRSGISWGWQVEHNGPWHWQVGERADGMYLALTGPTDDEHQWTSDLAPGETFTSVPASIVASAAGPEGAFAELTLQRRAIRRPHHDTTTLPVIFNDYMNTLMGDPSTEKLWPLIEAAGSVGAEYFCIDAGWYADDSDWWDGVGEWQPSTARFPGGLAAVINHIRANGMEPGLWLEPELIGVRSPLAQSYPDEAFMQRAGHRITEHQRHHLDFSSQAVRDYMDERVDTLVAELGIRYFKLDYNVTPGPGTDGSADGASLPSAPGEGLLRHNRAYLGWLRSVLDRHPDLILENCASGAMRMDYAMLSELQLQSTSDQQDLLRYPPIAAAAPASILPEQAANWAYPQPEMTQEEMAFTLATGLLGRMYLTGHLNRMDDGQRALVASAVAAHQGIRHDLARSVPSWPLGLPSWRDPAVALALVADDVTYLTLWRRPGATDVVDLPLAGLAGELVDVTPVFPAELGSWQVSWDSAAGVLRTSVAAGSASRASARVLKVTRRAAA
ncbi:alpha-galactosidase [Sanguibacter gelidistatuariae]|uniref:Alpha-galactosidase n=1 Tax=Sanguibacter gelidistatuariae TaxID=1814289 RepID=A0A1G6XA47_9MICO|nr:glycoside hydrolase family 36 protein [Sanguibacter gelidistatuariae]SDD74175.1 alpha-galactosidase [Sanguibacter gelidistatuariae]